MEVLMSSCRSRKRSRATTPAVDGLEDRSLLSHAGMSLPHTHRVHPDDLGFSRSIVVTDPGEQAILNALNGGAGSDFVKLLRREVRNPAAVIGSFVSGMRTEFTAPGFAAKLPHSQPQYTGTVYDQWNGTVAGALLQPNGNFEFAAIMRGPIHNPITGYYVWGVNRGGPANARTSPGLPGQQYDSEVVVAASSLGVSSAAVVDLQANTVTPIDPSQVLLDGPTIRVTVPGNVLPANQGLSPKRFQFGFWATTDPNGGLGDIESFVPDNQSVPIGIEPGRAIRSRVQR
jgi:hypothetical protein